MKQVLAKAVTFPAVGKEGKPVTRSIDNVAAFLSQCPTPVRIRKNVFNDRIELEGLQHHSELTDTAAKTLWLAACKCGLTDTLSTFTDILVVLADKNRFHPVLQYLEAQRWDGTPRVDRWLSTYVGVVDTPLHRAYAKCFLLGAVHRVCNPGCKHDTMLVLEGRQGVGKSSVAAILGGDWFADGLKLGYDAKHTIEATRGRWIVEVPELSGMSNREVEAIKHQLSCQADRARLAYDRLTSEVPRQWVAVGTTNDDRYLKDVTGNRRFHCVAVDRIDLEALKRDRHQLWAEAYFRAFVSDESAQVPPELWEVAALTQEDRRQASAIEERLEELLDGADGDHVGKEDLWQALGIPPAARTQPQMNALTAAMRKLGWRTTQVRRHGSRVYAYVCERSQDAAGGEKVWIEFRSPQSHGSNSSQDFHGRDAPNFSKYGA